jgi:hypothetical protein
VGVLAALLIAFGLPAPASAATVEITGNPLTIWIGDNGSLQEQVSGNQDYSFYPRDQKVSNAGFALALPSAGQAGVYATLTAGGGKVWGWTPGAPSSGPSFNGGNFSPVSQDLVQGSGTSGDPWTQLTKYDVVVATVHFLQVEQTTSYVNGSSTFVVDYRVKNLQADAVKFRALVGADLFLNNNDCGTGVFKAGPPRFVGGSSLGRLGGFTEEPSSAWTHYFEGQIANTYFDCQSLDNQWPNTVWDRLVNADGGGFGGVFNGESGDSVNASTLDNGIGVQWDTYYTAALPGTGSAPANRSVPFQLNTLGTVPGQLTLSPSSQSVSLGSQAGLTASVTDGSGAAAQNVAMRFSVSGSSSASGNTTTDGNGQAGFSYKPSKAGTDTVTAFEDVDGNGVQGQLEPGASATVTVKGSDAQSDKTPPRLRIIVRRSVKRKVLLKGLVTAANSSEPASLRFELLGPAKPKAKTFTRKLARKSLPMGKGGTRAVVLRAKAKKLLKATKFKVRVRVTAIDRAGNRAVATKLVAVK